jgi:O-antigen/teichoic acid export membrane protein
MPRGNVSARAGLLRNVFHLGLGQVVTTVLAVVLSGAIARALGASDFGLLYLITSITLFTYVIVDWGHGQYVTREVALQPERAGELIGSATAVRVGMLLLLAGPAVGIAWLMGYDTRTRWLAAAMILAWLPATLGLSYAWVFRARERMDYDALLSVTLKSTNLALAFLCLSLGGRVLSLIGAYAAAGMVTCFLAVFLYRRLGLPRARPTKATARELIRDGAPIFAINVAVALQPYIDANILYRLAPPHVVGWYGATWTIAGTLVAPATILGASMYPRLSRVSTDRTEFRRTLRAAFRPLLFVAILGAVGTYLFADFAIGVIYSEQKFGPAADILRAFTPALTLIYIDMLLGYAILAVGKAGQLAKAKIVAVVVTTVIELALIPYFQTNFSNGGIGIVLAMACGELVMVTAAVLLIRDIVAGAMILDFFRGLAAGVATVALVRWLPPVTPLLGIPLCVAVFAALSAAAGLLTRRDVELLSSMFRKRGPAAPEIPAP